VSNLLGNAVKYSPAGSTITVVVGRAEGAGAMLAVRERGIGIPAADLPHFFERFHWGSNVAGRIAGTGISLATARQIVEHHGGTITVESWPDTGSTFTVWLPRAASEDLPSTTPVAGHVAGTGRARW
jgi:signal transduction histidine kinase